MKEKFYPNCRLENGNILVCQPYIESNGEIIDKAVKPLQFRISDSGELLPISIEGASSDLIRRLKEAINNGDI